MELKEFIKAAITDITEAVSELQNELGGNAVVSPPMPAPISLKTLKQNGRDRLISNIDFDVAVTVGNVDSIEGGVGANLLQVFSAKASTGNESKSENISRITFSIPVIYPTAEITTDADNRTESAKRKLHASRPDHPISSSVVVRTEENREPAPPSDTL